MNQHRAERPHRRRVIGWAAPARSPRGLRRARRGWPRRAPARRRRGWRAAPDPTAARAAPSRARAAVSHLDRGAVVEERARDLREVLHVRTKDDWLCRTPPARGYCGRRHRRGCRRRTPTVATWNSCASSPIVSRTTTSSRGSASTRSSLRRATFQPPRRASRSTSSNRSGLRGAMISSALPARRADALKRFEDRLLFAFQRAGGDDHRTVAG